jgi:hypothetical protein
MSTLNITQPLARFSRLPSDSSGVKLRKRHITKTSLALMETIYRYRFIPTSLLFKLVAGDKRNLYFHLQALYHTGFINRLSLLNQYGYPDEFIYYLDNPKPLELLAEQGIASPDELDFERLSHGQSEISEGRLLFVRHELMISRLRACLELACVQSGGEVVLHEFRQGAELHNAVIAPGLGAKGEVIGKQRQQMLFETLEEERIPHRPDAFFTLYFPNRADRQQYSSFLYEADRRTMDTSRMIKKLRGHFHFIVKQKLHKAIYNVPGIRAVLIETLDRQWAETLRQSAGHPAVSGPKPSNLFWFTSSEFFTETITKQEGKRQKRVPYYQENPSTIFNPLWFTPNDQAGDKPHSILDV